MQNEDIRGKQTYVSLLASAAALWDVMQRMSVVVNIPEEQRPQVTLNSLFHEILFLRGGRGIFTCIHMVVGFLRKR
jgi:hypothetical protein